MTEELRAWDNAQKAATAARRAADVAYAEWAYLNAVALRLERAASHAFDRLATSSGYVKGSDCMALTVRAADVLFLGRG